MRVRAVAKKAASRKKTAKRSSSAASKKTAGKKSAKASKKSAAQPKTKGQDKAAETKKRPRKKPKGKSPMTKAQLKTFREMLLEKRRELVGDMTGIEAEAFGGDRDESKGDISDHPADAGTDNFEQEFSLGLLESERVLLAEIDAALHRIDEGTYGICLGTGKPIGVPRLKARPWAPYSIEYARMIEKGLVRPGERVEGGEDEDEDE